MKEVTVRKGYKILIPAEVRKQLEVGPGNRLRVVVQGKVVISTKAV